MAGEQVVPPPPQQADQPPQAVDAAAAAVPLERSPARGQQLTPDEVILNLHNQINHLNEELRKKDQAIAMGNATTQALEADRLLAEKKNLDLEDENKKMNDAIMKSTNAVKQLQDENFQLKLHVDKAESARRTERAFNIQNLESLIQNPAKKVRMESPNASGAESARAEPQSMKTTSSCQDPVSGIMAVNAGASPASNAGASLAANAGASPALNAGASPVYSAGALPGYPTGALPAYPAGGYQQLRPRTPSMTPCRETCHEVQQQERKGGRERWGT